MMAFRNDFLFKKFLLFILWWTIVRSQQELISSDYLVESNQEWTEDVHSERIISHSSKKEEKSYISNTYEGFDQNFNLTTLMYVAIITRHGSRSPLHTFPNDPYPFNNLTFWPDGPKQLTRYGKQQLYESGRNIRSRYNGFLSQLYIPHEISVRSNVFDRDFMSAACLLAGLYPPSDYQLWNPKIYWQPVPIWEDPLDVSLLVTEPSNCPRFEIYQKRSVAEFNSESSQHRNLLEYVSKHVGKKVETLTELGDITDTLIMQQENGYKLPLWTKNIYPEPLFTLGAAGLAAVSSGSPQMIRFAAGALL
ncbi:lysosomal acid phosphatase-like isoform X2 [Rhodnius prolixus]|uniref:lysosomal acid phosphatase-like isoform X2 n=1 Tax=Rhodnius prolixus TaxID=13249 RepID=UPI003D188A2E